LRPTLPIKVLGIVGAVMLAYAAGSFVMQRHVVLREFGKLEAESAQRDLQRGEEAFEREQEAVGTMASDWGNWTDIHEYMKTREPAVPERDLSRSAMDGLGVDYVSLVDNTGRIVWTRSLDPESRESIPPPPVEDTALATWTEAMRNGERRTGLVRTPHGPMLLAIGPILNGEGGGPRRGTLLLGRYFTPKVIAQLADRTRLDLAFIPLAPGATAGGDGTLESPGNLELTKSLADISGAPLMRMRVRLPRDLLDRGQQTVQLAAGSIVLGALVALAVLVALLRKLVLQPVSRLSEHVQRIGNSDDLTQRLGLDSNDEIGQLGAGIDSMVDQLRETRARLMERSYEAGAAEMVRGTLHNVGNALTPMSVHGAGIVAALKAAPLPDVGLALQELENAAGDVARAAVLRRFAGLALAEAAAQLATAATHAEQLHVSLDNLQDMLRLQMGASKPGHVRDTTGIGKLIDEAVGLCPPDRMQRIRIEVDPALRALPPLRLPAMLLKQVFQNLMINAAEAMPDGRPGVLYVCGQRIEDGRGTWLQLAFTDTGSGIAADAVAHLFEHGFSTKDGKRNSGIGLHWCANALASVGGTIAAASEGPGHGATFTLSVPLEHRKEQAA
jgi:sensor domain CHASE-containing protein